MEDSNSKETIVAEAESLEEAKSEIKSQIPDGKTLLSEKIISDGKIRTVEGMAETIEEAYGQAESKIPEEASIIEKKEVSQPVSKVRTVEAIDEKTAEELVASEIRSAEKVKGVKLIEEGKKGLFGIGKKPNQYEVQVLSLANVEVTYKTKAKIIAEVGIPISQRLDEKVNQLEQLIKNCTEMFDLPTNIGFMSGEKLSHQTITEDLGKFLAGLQGQAGAWRTGKFQGQSVRQDQLVSGFTPLLRDWLKLIEAWTIYGMGGDGMSELETLHQDLTAIASDAKTSTFPC